MKFRNIIFVCVVCLVFLVGCSKPVKVADSAMTGIEFANRIALSAVSGDKDLIMSYAMPFDFVLSIYKFKGVDFDNAKIEQMSIDYAKDKEFMVVNFLELFPAAGVSNESDIKVDYLGYDSIVEGEREMLFSIGGVGQFADVDFYTNDKLFVSLRVFQFNNMWYFFVK